MTTLLRGGRSAPATPPAIEASRTGAPLVGGLPSTFVITFALCLVAYALPMLFFHYLPMVDLPQHLAQLAIWRHHADPGFAAPGTYDFHWFTPYLLTYLAGRALAQFMEVSLAIRVLLLVATLSLPVSVLFLLRSTGRDPWWSLLAFPLAFGLPFYWGFLSFQVALPLAVLHVGLAIRHGRRPTWRSGALFALSAIILFFTHALAFGVANIAAAAYLLASTTSWRGLVQRMLPLVPSAIVTLAWFAAARNDAYGLPGGMVFDPLVVKIAGLFSFMLAGDFEARLAAWGFLAAATLLTSIRWPRGRDERADLAPFVAVGLTYLALPSLVMGTAVVYHRFAGLLVLLALPAARPPRRLHMAILLSFSLAWPAVLAHRFAAFDAEAKPFDAIIDRVPAESSLALVAPPAKREFPAAYYEHFAAYYQARKGGRIGNSFAAVFNFPWRLTRPGTFDRVTARWSDYRAFDYVVFRGRADFRDQPFYDGNPAVWPVLQSGDWQLFQVLGRRPDGRDIGADSR